MRFKIHRAQFPSSHWIFDTFEKPTMLLRFADLKPVLDKDNAVVLQQRLERRAHTEEVGVLFIAAKSHDMLDESTVVPAAIEDSYFPRSRHFFDVSLSIQL